MTTKINGYSSGAVQIGTDKKVPRTRDAAGPASAAPAQIQSAPVQITDKARQLAALEAVLQGLPEVDQVRVNALRQAIEDGRYQINPERIAEKLLQLERELTGR